MVLKNMRNCINSNRLPLCGNQQETPSGGAAEGFDGLELVVDDLEEPDQNGKCEFMQETLPVAALTTGVFNLFSLAQSDGGIGKDALNYFTGLLRCASERKSETDSAAGKIVVIGANSVVMPGQGLVESYQRGFNLVFKSLEILVRTADELKVYLTLENPADQLFLSPLELRDLLNKINNPYIGVAFNPSHARRLGSAIDWLRVLGRHCVVMRVPLEDSTCLANNTAWNGVIEEFRRYDAMRMVIYY
jgi:hexulose-6-phosphate isomerase